MQAQIQREIERQRAISPASVNFAFLRGLLEPYQNAAATIDVGLRRDRTDVQLDLGRMASLGWTLSIEHENRVGNRESTRVWVLFECQPRRVSPEMESGSRAPASATVRDDTHSDIQRVR